PQSNSLPVPLTSFVGRKHEQAELLRLLQNHRLVTLAGPGGIGKTRLALQLAAACWSLADEVRFVDLAPVGDRSLVLKTVASALGVGERPGEALLDSVLAVLDERSVLLVLDNCEHVLEVCAATAETLLARAHTLTILATSREPLGVAGELTWRVPPL